MKRFSQALLGMSLAVSIVACGNDRVANDANPNPGANATPPAVGPEGGAAVGTSGAADRDFIQDQLEDGQAEISLGKIAAERASHPQVKQFAQMMVRDHQMAGEELRQVATQANIQLNTPIEPDADHKDAQEEFAKLKGREFDRRYIDKMVDEHEEAVKEVEDKAESENAAVKQWASKTLPKLRQHLEQARKLQQTLEQAETR